MELASRRAGDVAPLGEIDLDAGGVEVDANNDETDVFDRLYGRLDRDEVTDCASARALVLGNLNAGGAGAMEDEDLEGAPSLGDVIKVDGSRPRRAGKYSL